MIRDHEPAEFAAGSTPTAGEQAALDAVAAKVRARGVLARLRGRTADPAIEARAKAVVAHFAEEQP